MAEGVMQLYDLRVTVERIEGPSVYWLAVGDYFEVTESSRIRNPPGRHFCMYALQAVLPLAASASRFGLARAGLARRLPGSRRAGDHANRAHREADTPHRRAHVSRTARELGLALVGSNALLKGLTIAGARLRPESCDRPLSNGIAIIGTLIGDPTQGIADIGPANVVLSGNK